MGRVGGGGWAIIVTICVLFRCFTEEVEKPKHIFVILSCSKLRARFRLSKISLSP